MTARAVKDFDVEPITNGVRAVTAPPSAVRPTPPAEDAPSLYDDKGCSWDSGGRQPVPQHLLDGTGGGDGTDCAVVGHLRGAGRCAGGAEQQHDRRSDDRCRAPPSDAGHVESSHHGWVSRVAAHELI
jgi:hypothetical protein